MPRPHEIAADARALYGPLALRPSAQEAGDGALWVDPSAQQPLTQVQSGNWVSLAPAGVPVLHGPYVVDYTDIPHDGDTMTLWTPQVGDVLLRLFPDWQTVVQWDQGMLCVGQNVDGTGDLSSIQPRNCVAYAPAGKIANGIGAEEGLDALITGAWAAAGDASGEAYAVSAHVMHTADPVQIQLAQTGGTDPTMGSVSLYALVARAIPVAP